MPYHPIMRRNVGAPTAINLPARPQAQRVEYYVDPAAQATVQLTPAQLAARQRRDAILYARWRARQAQIAARDAQTRKVLIVLAVLVCVGLLAAAGLVVWMLVSVVTSAGAPLVVAAVATVVLLSGVVGHRCVTVVQHWH